MAEKFKSGSTYKVNEKRVAEMKKEQAARNRSYQTPVKTLSKSEVAAANKKLGPKIKRGVRGRITQQDRVLRTETGWERDPKEEHAKERQRERRKPSGSKPLTVAQKRAMTKQYKSDASRTAGEKAAPRGGGRAKAAATRARNIAKSKKAGTYAKTAKNQTARNRARSGAAGFNPKLGRSSPTDFIRGGRAPGGIPRKKL